MIKYLGSKRLLIPRIVAVVEAVLPSGTVIDLFSGTSRVGHALKQRGYRVLANDHNAYASTLARCYVQADAEGHRERAQELIAELGRLPGRPGFVTETYCQRSRFFHPDNGARIDAIREAIEGLDVDEELRAVLLVSLMEAADRVDSTTGVQMAYLKKWASRALRPLELRVPAILPRAAAGRGEAWELDAQVAAAQLEGDICYLDPPYNQHKYLGNYHIWETLVRWDQPEVYGVACKRVDCRERRSAFNSKPAAAEAMRSLVGAVRAPVLLVSFSSEGYLSREEMEDILRIRGEVQVLATDFPRYVGARIGIHDPQGKKVGRISHVRNTEYLYLVAEDPAVHAAARAAFAQEGAL